MGNRFALAFFVVGWMVTALPLAVALMVRQGVREGLAAGWDLLVLAGMLGGGLTAGTFFLLEWQGRSRLVQARKKLLKELEENKEQLRSLQTFVQKKLTQYNPEDNPQKTRLEQGLKRKTEDLVLANQHLVQVEKDLDRLKESYRDLYHHSPVMYLSLDPEGRLITFNDTLLRTLGFQREELQDRPYQDLLPPQGVAHWNQQIQGATGHPLAREGEIEAQWRRKDGSFIDVWIRTIALQDDHGKVVRFRSTALDLTERNRLAQELRHHGDELERTNARLRLIINELEEFTHVVSHDLKEPLRTIQAFSQILAEDYAPQLDADGFQYINHLLTASRRLGNLIDDLLTLSQAGLITRSPEVFNLNEAVATVRRDLAHLILRKGADFLIEGSLPDVVGDQHRIAQLLANLVGNGLKYNTSPNPLVAIGQAPGVFPPGSSEGTDPRRITLYVRDNGIGIDPRYHQQIFGIFRRLHQEDEFEGTGAGLAICKKIVEAHGGHIWVESERDKGTTFFFTLPHPRPQTLTRIGANGQAQAKKTALPEPTAPQAPPTNGQHQHQPSGKERPSRLGSGPRLVLVEDMYEVGMIIQKLAQRSGQQVTWFTTAEEALVFLQHGQADLMLFDVNLPGMSGIDLARQVRHLPHLAQVPIAIFSQGQSPEDLEKLRTDGVDIILPKDMLAKPLEWQKRIQEILLTR
jgi:PAS domain S-box-containing protein